MKSYDICDNVFICLRKISDRCDNFFLGVDLSCATLFDDLYIEELQSRPGYEKLMYIGVEDLGVLVIFFVPGIVTFGFPGRVSL